MTSKDICLLFIILCICLFLFCLEFVLFNEALLLLHGLTDLVQSFIWKFSIKYTFWSDILSTAWFILDLLNIYTHTHTHIYIYIYIYICICICFGEVKKKYKTEKVRNWIDSQSSYLGFTSFNISLVYSLKRPINYCCRICFQFDNDANDNEFISAYLFYMKLALRPRIIYTKKKYYTIRYPEIIS